MRRRHNEQPLPVKKPAHFIGNSLEDLREFADKMQDAFGAAIQKAQWGSKAASAVPLRGYTGSGVLEVVEQHDGRAYRAVYTVRLSKAIYVLHVFEKKSTQGIKTPQKHIDTVNSRLRMAEIHHAEHYSE